MLKSGIDRDEILDANLSGWTEEDAMKLFGILAAKGTLEKSQYLYISYDFVLPFVAGIFLSSLSHLCANESPYPTPFSSCLPLCAGIGTLLDLSENFIVFTLITEYLKNDGTRFDSPFLISIGGWITMTKFVALFLPLSSFMLSKVKKLLITPARKKD